MGGLNFFGNFNFQRTSKITQLKKLRSLRINVLILRKMLGTQKGEYILITRN